MTLIKQKKNERKGYENNLPDQFKGDRGSPAEEKENSKGFEVVAA
jgi:hypothetical protein